MSYHGIRASFNRLRNIEVPRPLISLYISDTLRNSKELKNNKTKNREIDPLKEYIKCQFTLL